MSRSFTLQRYFNLTTHFLCYHSLLFLLFLSDGIGASDFGESLRFQKVLQGQEILGYNTPGDDNTRHPPEKRRLFPGLHGSGIALMRNGPRNPLINSETSSRGIVFDESFQFHKVLQGQEMFSSPFSSRAMATNEVKASGGCGPIEGVQLSRSKGGWPMTMQCENFLTRSSIPSVQVSSPSSVFMFQQSMVPVQSINAHNRGNFADQRIINKSTSHNSGTAFMTDHSSHTEVTPGLHPNSLVEQHQLSLSHPTTTTPAFTGSKDLSSTCKAGCRLFGFSLTEEKNVGNIEKASFPRTTPINAGTTTVLTNIGGVQCPLKPPLMSKVVGSNCTKVSSLSACPVEAIYFT